MDYLAALILLVTFGIVALIVWKGQCTGCWRCRSAHTIGDQRD